VTARAPYGSSLAEPNVVIALTLGERRRNAKAIFRSAPTTLGGLEGNPRPIAGGEMLAARQAAADSAGGRRMIAGASVHGNARLASNHPRR
jgi:hypothetical protein